MNRGAGHHGGENMKRLPLLMRVQRRADNSEPPPVQKDEEKVNDGKHPVSHHACHELRESEMPTAPLAQWELIGLYYYPHREKNIHVPSMPSKTAPNELAALHGGHRRRCVNVCMNM